MNIEKVVDKIIGVSFSLIFVLVPIILTPWNYELFEYNKMMITYALTAIIFAAWIVKMISKKKIEIAKTPFDLPIGLFVLSQFIATIFSMDPHISWFGYYSRFNGGLTSILSYTILFYAFVSNVRISSDTNGESTHDLLSIPRLLPFMLVTAALVALYGVLEHFGVDKDIWVQDVQSRVFSSLGQPNWLAAYLIALLPITWGLMLQNHASKLKIQNIIFSLLSLLFFLVLLYTRSRSGLVAFLLTDVIFWTILGLPFMPGLKRNAYKGVKYLFHRFSKTWIFVPFIVTQGTIVLLIFINGTNVAGIDRWVTLPGIQTQISNRMTKSNNENGKTQEQTAPTETVAVATPGEKVTGPLLETGGTESGTIRKYVWQAALNAWLSSPKTFLIGTGTETFAFAFYQFKPVGHNLTSEWDFLYNKAHNEYLNYLATTGIFGLGAYLFLIGSFIYWVVKKGKKNGFSDTVTLGFFVGWLSILITNFFGFSVVIIQILFFLIPALVYGTQRDKNGALLFDKPLNWTEKAQKISYYCASLILLLILSIIGILWFADKNYALGYHLTRAGQPSTGYTYLSKAMRLNPFEPIYQDERSSALATLAVALNQNEEATLASQLVPISIFDNDRALSVSPNNINFYKTRTKVFFALSEIDPSYLDEAIAALEKARVLAPSDPKILYNLAVLYGRKSDTTKGIEALKTAIALKPNYRDAFQALNVFYAETGQEERASAIIQKYLDTVNASDEGFLKLLGK